MFLKKRSRILLVGATLVLPVQLLVVNSHKFTSKC